MQVRFWGTRGSIARPGRQTLRYGGNTPCIEVRADDGTLVILDCGTGAHALGRELVASSGNPLVGHLLIGHSHWDHIQGFPFFGPLYVSGNEWEIYAPGGRRRQLEATLAGQMSYEYSPISLEAVTARVRLHDLKEGVLDLGGIRVTARYLNHPALALGYRLEADGATLVYASDHEPHSLHPTGGPPGSTPIHHEDQRHLRFLEDADLVIHDAQYVLDEFPAKAGWGHTPVERAVDYAILARAKRLALFHHDPDRHDDAIDVICKAAQKRARLAAFTPEVFAASEQEGIEISGEATRERSPSAPDASALISDAPRRASTVLVVDDDPDMVRLLELAMQSDGVRVLTAGRAESALELARRETPCLILLDMRLPGSDGLDLCRTLRAEPAPRLRDTPIVILTGTKLGEADLIEAFRAGATDYLAKPVKPTLVRSRVRSWLLRTSGA
jgi:CheY-like chemotaxis protein